MPYLYGYGYGYPYYDYGYPSYYGDRSGYLSGAPIDGTAGAVVIRGQSPDTRTQPVTDERTTQEGNRFLAQARSAFRSGDYRQSVRLAGHAAVEMPRSSEVHQFTSLSLFALAEYRGAASAAHAGLSVGSAWDWSTLRGFYADADDYTPQLRALEKHVRENPNAAYAHFLLGYHYLMLGHSDSARQKLSMVLKLTPEDKLAARLLNSLAGGGEKGANEAPAAPERGEEGPDGHRHEHDHGEHNHGKQQAPPSVNDTLDSSTPVATRNRSIITDDAVPWIARPTAGELTARNET